VLRTRNPTWAPVCGVRGGRHLHNFELRAVDAQSCEVLWRETVCLPELEPLCQELESMPGAAPLATPLVEMGGQWYSRRSAAGPPSAGEPHRASEPRRRSSVVKKIEASEICAAGGRVSTLLERLRALERQNATLREEMEAALASGCRSLREPRERRLRSERRVQQLRLDVEARSGAVALLRERLSTADQQNRGRAAGHDGSCARLRQGAAARAQAAAAVVEAAEELDTGWLQLKCRQMRMLHEVSEVYPIERLEESRCWSIRGLCIGGIDTLSRQDLREQKSVSTALGYLVHLLVTIADILQVPLCIIVQQPGCSRSILNDPHEVSPNGSASPLRDWPLFYSNGLNREKFRFETSLRLLQDGLLQFLYSRGYLDDHERRVHSGNLLECARLILQKETSCPDELG